MNRKHVSRFCSFVLGFSVTTAAALEPLLLKAFLACWNAKAEAKGCRALTDGSKARGRVLPDGTWTRQGCNG